MKATRPDWQLALSEAARRKQAGRWLVVGRAARAAVEQAWPGRAPPTQRARDVHRVLELVEAGSWAGCAVDARLLGTRPEEALARLQRRLGRDQVVVIDRPPETRARRPARHQRPPAAALPRADGESTPRRPWSAGRFASACLAQHGDLDGLLDLIVDALRTASGAGRVSVMLVDDDRRNLRIRRAYGFEPGLAASVRTPLGRGLAGRAAALGRVLTGQAGGSDDDGGTAYVILPLGRGAGCVGVVNLSRFRGDTLVADDVLCRLEALAKQAAAALLPALRLRRAEALMTTDALTGLPNRRAFESALRRELERSSRSLTSLGLALLDLDHFKRINDELGHPIGDRALQEVARRLEAALRTTDLVARWGGEEFAVLLPGLARGHEDTALTAVERLRQRIASRPFVPAPGSPAVTITVSCGLAIAPRDGREPAALLRAVDQALYAAKAAGRNTVRRA